GSSAESVHRLVVGADRADVPRRPGQKLQQAVLCDVGSLKLIDQDVAVFFLQRLTQLRVPLQQSNRCGDQRTKRNAVLFTQQFFAGPVVVSKLMLQRDRLQVFH